MNATLLERYGPTALVTGASSGIGEQFARLLAREGFDLLLSARRAPLLAALADQLRDAYGVRVDYHACDLADHTAVDALIERARAEEPGLLISNAGYGVRKGPFLSVPDAELEAMYRTNAVAPARLVRALLPAMIQRGRGGLLCTGSIEGDAVFPYSTAYAATKAFLHSLVLGLSQELRDSGVDVLLLAPGATDTEAPAKQGIAREALVGLMSPRDVAAQALARLGAGGAPCFTPGLRNRLLIGALRLLPRGISMRVAGQGMQRAIANSVPD